MRYRRILGIIGVLLALTVLAGCTHSSSSGNKSGASMGLPEPARDSAGGTGSTTDKPLAPNEGASSPDTARVAAVIEDRAMVRTGSMSVTVADVDQAAKAVSAEAIKAGGRVDGDDRDGTDDKRSAQLVLRVPPDKLDDLMSFVAGAGHESSRSVQGEDVTAKKADIDARVQALQTSVVRLRDFLKHSGTINDLVQLENQLTSREADLESMLAQQHALEDQVSLASLTVRLARTVAVLAQLGHDPAGFSSAVATGWHAVVLAGRWLFALIGYALPVTVLVGVIAFPWLVIRRRRRVALTAAQS